MSPGDAGMVRASNLGHLNGASGVRRFAGTWAAQLCHGDHSCNMNHGHRSRKRGMGFAERFIHPPYSLFFFLQGLRKASVLLRYNSACYNPARFGPDLYTLWGPLVEFMDGTSHGKT